MTCASRAEQRTIALAAILVLASGLGVNAQIPLGPEFRVDTSGRVAQFANNPRSMAITPNGGFVVAWVRKDLPWPSDETEVVARRFDAAGVGLGPEFIVNTYSTGSQYGPSVGVDAAGGIVIVWCSSEQGMNVGQRFDPSGTRLGAEFQVSTGLTWMPSIAVAAAGDFVVVWQQNRNPGEADIFGQRFDASGVPAGPQFQVNAATGDHQHPVVVGDGAGNVIVVWHEYRWSPSDFTGRGRRFTAGGLPQGPEFRVSSSPASGQVYPGVAAALDGSFVVAWSEVSNVSARRFDANGVPLGPDFAVSAQPGGKPDLEVDANGDLAVTWTGYGSDLGVFAARFQASGAPIGTEFQVNTYTTGAQGLARIASDPAGNFVIAWLSIQDGVDGVFAQRYAGGLSAAALAVDPTAGPTSDGNGVLEAGETVAVAPSWLNANFTAQTFTGTAASFTGPGTPGDPTYAIADGAASYGTVASGATADCAGDCYALGVTVPTTRPALHWDATLREDIAPANLGAAKNWTLHVGDSFSDVPRSNAFYRFVETILHHNVTAGCSTTSYCPASSTTREQMAVFVLVAKEGSGYAPPACTTPIFNDVPAASPFCRWIEELARRGVVTGCGGGSYCPTAAVSRQEIAVFVLATKEPGVTPPACGVPMFSDVPASSPFCPWIEELARRGVVTGCGGGAYCPTLPVTREQMAVFLSAGFGLLLYGP